MRGRRGSWGLSVRSRSNFVLRACGTLLAPYLWRPAFACASPDAHAFLFEGSFHGRPLDEPLGVDGPGGVERAHAEAYAIAPPVKDQQERIDHPVRARHGPVASVPEQAFYKGVLV